MRKHEVGMRLFLWEILPDRLERTAMGSSDQRPVFGEEISDRG